MKKILTLVSTAFLIFLLGFNPIETIKEHIDNIIHSEYEKLDNPQDLLDKLLAHMADVDPELTFENGQMLDSELGIPRLDILPFSEIEHFDKNDVIDGYIVRPVVEVDNPKLLILLKAKDVEASLRLNEALTKVRSDQWVDFSEADIYKRHLINKNQIIRQGNYLIYVTWEKSENIVKVFERHVR